MFKAAGHILRGGLLFVTTAVAALTLPGCGPSPTKITDDGATMVLVPAGTFPMGGKEEEVAGQRDARLLTYLAERPVHDVQVSAFYIDKHEVTNAQYRRFLEAVGDGRTDWDHPDQPADASHEQRGLTPDLDGNAQPAVGVSWYDAYAYCRWAGKRLPTEAEWERAARGDEYRVYPWGNDAPDADGIWWTNYRPGEGPDADGFRHTAPVGSFPDGVSPFGVHDLAGNAEEWVSDWYSRSYFGLVEPGVIDPPGPVQGTQRVIKSGSYTCAAHDVRIASRFWGRPQDFSESLGFRCAMTP